MKKAKRMAICLLLLAMVFSTLTVTALAADETSSAGSKGDFAGLIKNIWNGIKGQIKPICNDVIFPVLGGVLAIAFIVVSCMCYSDYKKSNRVNLTGPILLLIGSIAMFTAPLYLWTTIGW